MELFGQTVSIGSGIFLLMALAMALSFEFVNGFHDTANAVATVIYTHSPEALDCRHMVRLLEPDWCSDLQRRSRFWRARVASRRASAQRRVGSGIRHGFRTSHFGDHMEPRNLVLRFTRFQFAHAGGRNHGSRAGEFVVF